MKTRYSGAGRTTSRRMYMVDPRTKEEVLKDMEELVDKEKAESIAALV